jgi:EAL domain-containing protein (putative c-di-GMP-specific phosphodiesterase class I)
VSLPRNAVHIVQQDETLNNDHRFSPGALARSTNPDQTIVELLTVVREFTDSDVAYVGEFRAPRQIIRWSSGDSVSFGFHAGVGLPLGESYCSRLLAGHIPGAIHDTRDDERTRELAFTTRASVGSYLGTTIVLEGDRFFGTMCALTHEPRARSDPRYEHLMELIAPLVAEQIERAESISLGRHARFDRIRHVLDAANSLRVALQPIVHLDSREPVGFEALTRFADGRSPDHWFAEAWGAGLGLELEVAALIGALRALDGLPPGTYLSVNASPEVVIAANLHEDFDRLGIDGTRVVLELTEHAEIAEYEPLRVALEPLRSRGIRIAVDDAGAGFASLRHVLTIEPDIVKLDVSLTRGIKADPARAALASLFASFAVRIGATIVAEGIETEEDLGVLRSVGINFGQGYLLGRPEETELRTPDRSMTTSALEEQQINAPYLR